MERIILHIDVNNAFLSWTALYLLKTGFSYDIRKRNAVISGNKSKRKGIVLAKSDGAKKLGVKTADTLYSAHQKCPNLEVYPSNYDWYLKMSESLFKLLSKYTNEIEVFSVDECFLDYTKVKKLYGNEITFAYKIKQEIYDTLGFTVNIGIGNNKLCAKMASDFLKPNKVHTLYQNEIETKMYPLDIADLFGIGKKTVPKLKAIKINTIGDLASANENTIYRLFKNQGKEMIQRAKGIDDSPVVYWPVAPKGIGNEITLEEDISKMEELFPYLHSLAEHVGVRVRKQKKYAYVIVVTLKNNHFKRSSHQKKLLNPTSSTEVIYKQSCDILKEMWQEEPIRLIGIRLDKLTTSSVRQISLFEETKEEKIDELEQLMDQINEKYGNQVIRKASLNGQLFHKRLK